MHGIANERGIANLGVEVRSDQTWSFSKLPDFLKGATFFKTVKTISENLNLDIVIYRPTTIVVLDYGNAFNLPTKGWKDFSGSHSAEMTHYTFSNIYVKAFTKNGPKRINLGTPSTSFVGIIFVRGNK